MATPVLGPKLEYGRLRTEFLRPEGRNPKVLKFGTSGIRLPIGTNGFTRDVVTAATKAVAELILSQESLMGRPMIVTYDTHFLSKEAAELTAAVLANEGINVLLTQRDIPTPLASNNVLKRAAAGSINITCSHNPGEEQGFKFNPEWAGPADKATTDKLGERATAILNNPKLNQKATLAQFARHLRAGRITYFDPIPEYIDQIESVIDFDLIKRGLGDQPVVVDALFGTSAGIAGRILRKHGIITIEINQEIDPSFRRVPPNPRDDKRRTDPSQPFVTESVVGIIKHHKAAASIHTDGDADRYAVRDSLGVFIPPNSFGPMAADYLINNRTNWPKRLAVHRTVPTSKLMDAVAVYHGREVKISPVGFKYPAEMIRDGEIVIGTEESAGLSVKGHTPEKDGILAGFLALEMIAARQAPLSAQYRYLVDKVGVEYFPGRNDLTKTEAKETKVKTIVADPSQVKEVAGLNVVNSSKIDGVEFELEDGSRVLIRMSGTEPIIKVYAESARSESHLADLLRAGEALLAA